MISKLNIPIRVYWEDTDGGGVVYHARYVNFFERARTEWLRQLGFEQSRLQRELDIVFAIHRMEIDFLGPARLDDQLRVSAAPVKLGAASMRFQQRIHRCDDTAGGADTDELIARADVYAACLTASGFKPVRIPEAIKVKLKSTITSEG